ncbi:hypothetical protein L596_020451 [Steinernema carpocapsae]|uniref:Uncharacterized protein n=1 Tax=Steinernema carpocapsae TaxID=34508 RepID=A0A4U5MTN6_STECR|nr:hypothetical protein L596_020451 [Steinernema carpocapsae]
MTPEEKIRFLPPVQNALSVRRAERTTRNFDDLSQKNKGLRGQAKWDLELIYGKAHLRYKKCQKKSFIRASGSGIGSGGRTPGHGIRKTGMGSRLVQASHRKRL